MSERMGWVLAVALGSAIGLSPLAAAVFVFSDYHRQKAEWSAPPPPAPRGYAEIFAR